MKNLSYAALAAALGFAAPAMAQLPAAGTAAVSPPATTAPMPSTTVPSTSAPSTGAPATGAGASATVAADADAAGTNASVTTGMSVKDKEGAVIGEVTGVKPDATGKNLATIQMGADSFSVDTASMAVTDGAAMINASKDDIAKMLKK